MKNNKKMKYPIIKEAILDTSIGLPLSWICSYLILLAMVEFANLMIISLTQTVVLTFISISRKYLIRKKFRKLGY